MKSGDAKLKGLRFNDDACQLPNTITPSIYVDEHGGGFFVLKMFMRGKYYYHLIQHRHNALLQQDCLDEELRAKLMVRASYHNSKALEFGLRI